MVVIHLRGRIIQVFQAAKESSPLYSSTQALTVSTRAGPQNEKWSDRQITENPTGSMHKEARKKKFDPKKVDFD